MKTTGWTEIIKLTSKKHHNIIMVKNLKFFKIIVVNLKDFQIIIYKYNAARITVD